MNERASHILPQRPAEAIVLVQDLARDAADLMSVSSSGQMRSLNRLAELAVREVPGCCGASAILLRDRELVGLASTHPDLAELTDFQLRTGQGPVVQAMRDSVRPNAIKSDQVPLAETLAAFGGAALANASAFGDAQRETVQLRNAVESRAVVDQAKGILMHALGCSATDALERMRRVSQTQHVKVTDVAKQVVEGHGVTPRG